jgi:hypothetical protein
LSHLNPEEAEFGLNPWRAPEGILLREPADKFANIRIDSWASRATSFRFPAPIKPNPLAMPFDDSLRFDDEKSGAPIPPAFCQDDPKQSMLKMEGRPFSGSVQDGELLAKGEEFSHQFQTRRKEGASKRKEKREESHKREARSQKLDLKISGQY